MGVNLNSNLFLLLEFIDLNKQLQQGLALKWLKGILFERTCIKCEVVSVLLAVDNCQHTKH